MTSHNTEGEAEYYGCCVTFYREVDARQFWLAYECMHPRDTSSSASPTTNRFGSGSGGGSGGGGGADESFTIKSAVHGARFPAEIYTRGCHWSHALLVSLSGVHFSYRFTHCNLRPNTEGRTEEDR
jgi:hypothetical protein